MTTKKIQVRRALLIGSLSAAVAIGAVAGCGANQAEAPTTPVATQGPATGTPTPVEVDTTTPGQKNALRSAENYLEYQAFSKTGLLKQLEFEKYTPADAQWAVDKLSPTVDWNAQAVKKAKSYLEFQAFSRDGLVQQLEFEGFTPSEAEAGVAGAGL